MMANGDSLKAHPTLGRHAERLRALGYTTVDEVIAAAEAARQAATAFLGADVTASLPKPPRGFAPAQPGFKLGVTLDAIPAPARAFAMTMPSAAPLPASVNLVAGMPAIRDQASRGTCVAHAALSALEHLRQSQGTFQDMSEQFLYWNCKQNDGIPQTEGTWLGVAIPHLQSDGCCLETTWPYVPNPVPGNEGQDPPPAGAASAAKAFRIASFQQLAPTSVIDIKNELVRGRCVPFSVPVFASWLQNSSVIASGDIVLPFPGELRVGGHAMCICGYEDNSAEAMIGGGRFILRNSWNGTWGTSCRFGIGYGTIPYAYVSRFGSEAYSIE